VSTLSKLYYGHEFAGLVQAEWTKDKDRLPMAMTQTNPPTVPSAIPSAPPMTVYDCIVGVSREIAQQGIAKTRSNAQQGYKFRGIEDVQNALAPLLAKYRLVILPRILSRTVVEHSSRNGGVLFYVTVEAEFDFVSAADGSHHVVKTYGEAMDSADKGTNKAMSAAYKYAAFQTFCIPTEGDNDADASSPEPVIQIKRDTKAEPAIPTMKGRREGGVTDAPGTLGLPAQSTVDTTTGEVYPPGFAPIDDVKLDGAFLRVTWGRDAQGGSRTFSTKVPKIVNAAMAAYEDCVPVRLSSKDGKYLDGVERLVD
jgi:hypothetical protein